MDLNALVGRWTGPNVLHKDLGKNLNLLDHSGHLKPLSCYDYDQIRPDELRMWCHWNARYLLPTMELIGFLSQLLDGRLTVEIGAGHGDLGRLMQNHVKTGSYRMTDNHCQSWPDVKLFYEASGQPVIKYPKDVQRMDALEAVKTYKPEVVVGAWVTHWIDPNLPPPEGGGNMYGVKEIELVESVKTYVLIGAEGIHKWKAIMKLPHKTIDAPFVRSRRQDNKIWIWGEV